MDPDGKDNANPTILNPSDLPTRRISTPTAKRIGIFDALAPAATTTVSAAAAAATPSLPDPSFLFSPNDPAHAYHPPGYRYLSAADSNPDEAFLSSDTDDSLDHHHLPREEIDAQEVYDLIARISDPEHPLSLGSLGVVKLDDIAVFAPSTPRSRISSVRVLLTPTTSACSLTTVIGLGVKVRLLQALPPRFRVDVRIKEGTSRTADEANKQLGDKERVAAAMENRSLVSVINTMLATCE